MIWLSADLSKSCSGLALWRDSSLLSVACLRAFGAKGKHKFQGRAFDSDIEAWRAAFAGMSGDKGPHVLVYESGLGHHMTTARILAEHRGGVLMLWRVFGAARAIEVNVNEWRRVAREAWGVSWPKDGSACKALAVSLVREHYRREVTEDEADAVLIGHWFIRTGRLK